MNNLFIRHGEVENKANIYYANLPGFYLSDLGRSQAKEAAIKIKQFNVKHIISSPLLRARQTAEIISKEIGINVEISENIIEWSGPHDWIGKTWNEIKSTDNYKKSNNNPKNLTNTGESLKSVFVRVQNIYDKYENALFISHQDTIRAFTYYYLEETDFTKNRPDHCELQILKNKVIKTIKYD